MRGTTRFRPLRLVCKVGGSLLDGGWAPGALRVLARVAPATGILLVAGGGTAADRIRALHRRGRLTEEEAHWRALRVLNGTAVRLARGCGLRLPLTAALPAPPSGPMVVLLPHATVRADAELPRSWDVTSDSVAAWAAARLPAEGLLLLKSRDPPSLESHQGGLPVGEAVRMNLVDPFLPRILEEAPYEAWTVNGRHPDRLARFFTGDRTPATRLARG